MGFFSWKTTDTNDSIYNVHTKKCKPVYLLQPNGQEPIFEPAYDGYGVFGEVDAYSWLGKMNLPADVASTLSEDELRDYGIDLDCGKLCRDTVTGEIWKIFHRNKVVSAPIKYFQGSYMTPIPEYDGKCANDLLEEKRFEYVSVSSMVPINFPLKFSFNPDAVYEDLPASENCPHQGYFGSEI